MGQCSLLKKLRNLDLKNEALISNKLSKRFRKRTLKMQGSVEKEITRNQGSQKAVKEESIFWLSWFFQIDKKSFRFRARILKDVG